MPTDMFRVQFPLNFIFAENLLDASMPILYKNVRNVKFELFTETSNIPFNND